MPKSMWSYLGLMLILSMALWTLWGPQTNEDYTQNMLYIVVGIVMIGIGALRSLPRTNANSKHWKPGTGNARTARCGIRRSHQK